MNIDLEPNLAKKFKSELSQADYDPSRLKRNEQLIASQDVYMITLYNFSICDTTTWVLDTESSVHICNSLQGLQVSRKFMNSESFLNMRDGAKFQS